MALPKSFYHASLISLLIALTAACEDKTPVAPPETNTPPATRAENAPNERLETDTMVARSYSEGMPGSAVTAVETLTATVVEIDRDKRLVVLEDKAGHRRKVQVPPEAVNFDRVEVGDRVKIIAAVETVVSLGEPGTTVDDETDRAADAAERAEQGERAGRGTFVTERNQLTATIESIDAEKRMATLKFGDGSTRTVPVRDDVVMSQDYVGKKLDIVITTALASHIEKLETAPVD